MRVKVTVLLPNRVLLPETSVCWVEVRDVSLLDAPSITICSHQAPATEKSGTTLMTAILNVPDNVSADRHLNVWSHLSLTGSKRVQKGDFLTMQAYPVKADVPTDSIVVELQPVS